MLASLFCVYSIVQFLSLAATDDSSFCDLPLPVLTPPQGRYLNDVNVTLSCPHVPLSPSSETVYCAAKNHSSLLTSVTFPLKAPTRLKLRYLINCNVRDWSLSRPPIPLPTVSPSAPPSASLFPAIVPTTSPTIEPAAPTASPTADPTASPSTGPTATPTSEPIVSPTIAPTLPTATPTTSPITVVNVTKYRDLLSGNKSSDLLGGNHSVADETLSLSNDTYSPTAVPSDVPTKAPSSKPTHHPTTRPTPTPTTQTILKSTTFNAEYVVVMPAFDTFPVSLTDHFNGENSSTAYTSPHVVRSIPPSLLSYRTPSVSIHVVEKNIKQSSAYCKTPRNIRGRIIVLNNPLGHFDVRPPVGGCSGDKGAAGGLELPTVSGSGRSLVNKYRSNWRKKQGLYQSDWINMTNGMSRSVSAVHAGKRWRESNSDGVRDKVFGGRLNNPSGDKISSLANTPAVTTNASTIHTIVSANIDANMPHPMPFPSLPEWSNRMQKRMMSKDAMVLLVQQYFIECEQHMIYLLQHVSELKAIEWTQRNVEKSIIANRNKALTGNSNRSNSSLSANTSLVTVNTLTVSNHSSNGTNVLVNMTGTEAQKVEVNVSFVPPISSLGVHWGSKNSSEIEQLLSEYTPYAALHEWYRDWEREYKAMQLKAMGSTSTVTDKDGQYDEHKDKHLHARHVMPTCSIVTNGGFFNTSSGACFGNVISSHTVHSITDKNVTSFGIKNGRYYIGRLPWEHLIEEAVIEKYNNKTNSSIGRDSDSGATSVEEDEKEYFEAEKMLDDSLPTSSFDTLISGLGWLVRDGKSYIAESISSPLVGEKEDIHAFQTNGDSSFARILSARTAIGHDKDGRLMLLQVEGMSWERGMSLYEFADFCVDLGFVNAVNLDGGGSATMSENGILISEPSWRCGAQTVTRKGNALDDISPFIQKFDYCEKPVASVTCVHGLTEPPPWKVWMDVVAVAAEHTPSFHFDELMNMSADRSIGPGSVVGNVTSKGNINGTTGHNNATHTHAPVSNSTVSDVFGPYGKYISYLAKEQQSAQTSRQPTQMEKVDPAVITSIILGVLLCISLCGHLYHWCGGGTVFDGGLASGEHRSLLAGGADSPLQLMSTDVAGGGGPTLWRMEAAEISRNIRKQNKQKLLNALNSFAADSSPAADYEMVPQDSASLQDAFEDEV